MAPCAPAKRRRVGLRRLLGGRRVRAVAHRRLPPCWYVVGLAKRLVVAVGKRAVRLPLMLIKLAIALVVSRCRRLSNRAAAPPHRAAASDASALGLLARKKGAASERRGRSRNAALSAEGGSLGPTSLTSRAREHPARSDGRRRNATERAR